MYDIIIEEIDDLIIGRTDKLDPNLFYGSEQKDANQVQAIKCLKYVIEDVLSWDIETAMLKFDEYIIRVLRLDAIMKYIDYPDEVDEYDPEYTLSILYPSKVKCNEETIVKKVYNQVISKERKQFPRDYFSGGIGFKRFCYCIKFIIEDNIPFASIPEIYDFFTYKPAERNFLLTYRLQIPIYQYKIDLYKVIYYITQDYEDAELWYSLYCFNREYRNIEKEV